MSDGTKYHNPYHFVPVKPDAQPDDLDVADFPWEAGHITHTRYHENTCSGRIVCRLTTETSIFVGSQREGIPNDEAAVKVNPFELDDKPAIPATSLRGLISSIAEAASNSALRILGDREYTCRKRVGRFPNFSFVKEPIGKTHEFFRELGKELLPFNTERTIITFAEQLFGFVEGKKPEELEPALALAGRVYFSHARFHCVENDETPYLPEVTLRILDSPKPPSPALYFKMAKGGNKHIAKSDLDPAKHHPQGRKFYLHHRQEEIDKECWKSDLAKLKDKRFKQKVAVTPVRRGAVFYFHVDFDNLSDRELGLLLYALRPAEGFRHKIGMGKPIGLGRVRIETLGVFLVNRTNRYTSAGLFAARYSKTWTAEGENPATWPMADEAVIAAPSGRFDPLKLHDDFRKSMDEDVRQAIELIGDPNPQNVVVKVHTPLVVGGHEEDETFKWFVANDQGSGSKKNRNKIDPARRCLEPLGRDSKSLPFLEALEFND